jgi:hypothetical protein
VPKPEAEGSGTHVRNPQHQSSLTEIGDLDAASGRRLGFAVRIGEYFLHLSEARRRRSGDTPGTQIA